ICFTVAVARADGPTTVIGAFDPATNTGVLPLKDCGPNGASVGPHTNIMLGCTPGNVPTNTTTQVINAKTKNFVEVGNITGSDEVWFNSGDRRYYLGASKDPGQAVLGVVDAETNFLIEKIRCPLRANSGHWTAALSIDGSGSHTTVPCQFTGKVEKCFVAARPAYK